MKRILFYQWKAYNGPDVLRLLREMGYEVETFAETFDDANGDPSFEEKLYNKINHDLIFSIDYFTLISNVAEKKGIPYISWSCDAALTSMYNRSIHNGCNYIFFFDKADYLEFRSRGLQHVFYLPLAPEVERIQENISRFNNAPKTDKYHSEISFVGSLYHKNKYDALAENFDPYLRGYLDAAIEAQFHVSGGNILELLLTTPVLEHIQERYQMKGTEESESNVALYFARNVLGYKVAAVERQRSLTALAGRYSVSLYSTEEMRGIPLQGLLQKGPVDYWTEMPEVFAGSKINLNITIPNIMSGIPLRVWDILGAGGFCLTNYRPELLQFFENGKDLVIYEGIDELLEKADYYLQHDEEREEIARCGHNKVQQLHTLRMRLQEMMQQVENDRSQG